MWCGLAVFYELPFVVPVTLKIIIFFLLNQLNIISHDLEFLSDQLLRLKWGRAKAHALKNVAVCPSEVLTCCGVKG